MIYNRTKIVESEKFVKEMKASSIGAKFVSLTIGGDNLDIEMDSTLSGAEETVLDDTVTAHTILTALEIAKHKKNLKIDHRTSELILEGFVYDSKQFSLSMPAQTNWIGLKQAVDEAVLTPPIDVGSKDDKEEYELTAAADVTAFYGAALGAKKGHLDSGRALKLSVEAATDIAGVDAVVDTR